MIDHGYLFGLTVQGLYFQITENMGQIAFRNVYSYLTTEVLEKSFKIWIVFLEMYLRILANYAFTYIWSSLLLISP